MRKWMHLPKMDPEPESVLELSKSAAVKLVFGLSLPRSKVKTSWPYDQTI